MNIEAKSCRWGVRSTLSFFSLVLLVLGAVLVAAPGPAAAQEAEHHEPAGEPSEATAEHEVSEGHGGEHHHRNHVALFIGSTEGEEHHGEKEDRDFTLGVDYERRLSKWFGAGAMLDWIAEGNREYLVGPLFILHAGRNAKFFGAPCYQRLHESGESGFVFRTGFAWDFFFNKGKYTVFPAVYYDFTEEQDFLVIGVGFGMGF